MVIFDVKTTTPQETHEVAKSLAENVQKGEVIFIEGELGAGKTEFVRGFVLYHDVKLIRSPSFTVVFEHRSKFGFPIYHIDLYRFTGDFLELLERGIIDIFEKKNGIVLVEWADRIEEFYSPDYKVKIERLSDSERHITVEKL